MKKRLLLFLILIILVQKICLFSNDSEDKNRSFFFYIPSGQDINTFFSFYQYLVQWDKNEVKVSSKQLVRYYEGYVNQDSFRGLLFESFLLQTQNEKIQKRILKLINSKKYNDAFSQALYRKYNSKKKTMKQNGQNQIQFNYDNQYYDENINLFYMYESLTFNKKLGLMLFENNWSNVSFNAPEKDPDKDSFFLMYGGGTNAMTIHFNQYKNISFDDFFTKEIKADFNSNKNKKWKIREIDPEGVLLRSGADKIFIGTETGPDIIPEIDKATFSIYLYNTELKTGYSLSYFMNFSRINNNYAIRHRIWNHLLMQLTLTFINLDAN